MPPKLLKEESLAASEGKSSSLYFSLEINCLRREITELIFTSSNYLMIV
jgi:hypothetical protein